MGDPAETAAILAGGLATRLPDAVDDRPKCLAEAFGQEWRGVRIRYSVEPTPLGTAGAAKLAARLADAQTHPLFSALAPAKEGVS